MEWSDVRIFLAIVRSGTLGGAARALRLSQPTIGRRLRALEQATGQTLFQRTADGFVPTEEGTAIIALAEQMEEGALAMERRLAGKEQDLHGRLRISSADWFGAYVLPPVIDPPKRSRIALLLFRLLNTAERSPCCQLRVCPRETLLHKIVFEQRQVRSDLSRQFVL